MVRIIIKGGVWRNTEDEILKAAISKYGKNQWARISSLLVRKTPKQCKARWYEWLDPSIKKVEWSKTEDEKLLHLAKLMPTQWRTIAPIVGRTATQCLERYQKLLDDAEQADDQELGLGAGDDPETKEAEGVRSLRAGEIDTDPETRAARPDPVDMDDDEKEMLSEARARLANTQGKKAKRKARERQLEEAKRLAFLQKKRELKAAGINLREKKKKKGMDYNADIPLEHRPAPGFYDTTEEAAKTYSAPIGQSLRALEGKRKQEIEEQDEKNKRRKGGDDKPKNQAAQFVAAREAQIKKLKEQEQVIRRRKLNLPLPQVGERELEDIVKIGQAGEQARELAGDADGATGRLLGEYEGLGQAKMARTPRTSAPAQDNIMNEARNLRAMSSAQTPLLGEENTPLRAPETGTGYSGATPRHEVASTPNPLATPRGGADGMTPRSVIGGTPMRTPFRDSLSINDATPSGYGETPADQKRRMRESQRSLKAAFAALPKPENNFELAEEDDEEEDDGEGQVMMEEDAAERDARLKAAREEEERRELERRSTVVKRGLPRPANVHEERLFRSLDAATSDLDGTMAAAMRLINLEVAALMKHDSIAHPLPGSAAPGGGLGASDYDMPEDEYVAMARSAIHSELASSMGLPGANEAQLRSAVSATVDPDSSAFASSWASSSTSLLQHPSLGSVSADDLTPAEVDVAYRHMISASRDRMIASATTAAKAEKKLAKQFGGYMALNAKAKAGCAETIDKIHQARRDLETFGMLRGMEEAGAPARVERKREEVARLERREGDLQARYAELLDERKELQRDVEQLEEDKMVLEAQAALDAQEEAEGANGDASGDAEGANGEAANGDVQMDGQ